MPTFLRFPLLAATCLALCAPGGAAFSQEAPIRIGVAAPATGSYAIVGAQIISGAASAAGGATIVNADTACTAEGGKAAAERFVGEKVDVAVGFLCTAALEAALPILAAAAIPTIDAAVRADRIMKRRPSGDPLVWRVAPGSSAEAEAIARFVRSRWGAASFGIVEDGSSYGRDLADAVRAILERDGLRPALFDNYRPAEEKQFAIARRIGQSGVSRILVFGTRGDIAIIARDAAASGLDLTLAGGESLVDESVGQVPLPAGVLAVASGFDVDWAPSETAPPLEGSARAAAISVEISAQAVRSSRASGRTLSDILDADSFETSAGTVRFGPGRSADVVPFRVYRWDGARFVADGES